MAESTGESLNDARCAALRAVYEEICKSHDSVSEFRGKLLALLPLASGTGLFAVANINKLDKPEHLLAIGIFGGLVTFALYMYEIRGIQHCTVLTRRGKALENILVGGGVAGAFTDFPRARLRITTNTFAAATIYPATFGVWAYVAFCGLDPSFEPRRIPTALVIFVLFMFAGLWASKSERDSCLKETESFFDKEGASAGSTSNNRLESHG